MEGIGPKIIAIYVQVPDIYKKGGGIHDAVTKTGTIISPQSALDELTTTILV